MSGVNYTRLEERRGRVLYTDHALHREGNHVQERFLVVLNEE